MILMLRRPRQKDGEFKTSVTYLLSPFKVSQGYLARPCVNKHKGLWQPTPLIAEFGRERQSSRPAWTPEGFQDSQGCYTKPIWKTCPTHQKKTKNKHTNLSFALTSLTQSVHSASTKVVLSQYKEKPYLLTWTHNNDIKNVMQGYVGTHL